MRHFIRHTLKPIVLSLALVACADGLQQDRTHDSARVDTFPRIDTVKKTGTGFHSAPGKSDTLIVDNFAAVFVEPDSLRIEKQKKQIGEKDFYAGADDYLFYMNTAHEFLDSVKLTLLEAKDKRFIKFIGSDKTQQIIRLDTLPELWTIYFFDPSKKAKQVDMTMIEEEYKIYFK